MCVRGRPHLPVLTRAHCPAPIAPDSTVSLEVRVEDETVWLTQQQIADLFGTKRPAITKHLSNIFQSGELEENSVCSILERTAADGKHFDRLRRQKIQ